MIIDDIKNLEFFDSNGYNLNLTYNDELNIWEGEINLKPISVGLFSTETIFIYDRLLINGSFVLGLYQDSVSRQDIINIRSYWSDGERNDAFKLFDFSNEIYTSLNSVLLETDEVNYYGSFFNNAKVVTDYNPNPIRIDISFNPLGEDIFTEQLVIAAYNQTTDETIEIARISFYSESIGEDERLKVLCNNLGLSIDNVDYCIFAESDSSEELFDYKLLNVKRKEMLLNIRPLKQYLNSYRTLIAVLNFYGFDFDVGEYWKNINETDPNFGRYLIVDAIKDGEFKLYNDNAKFNLPNAIYKKTRFLQLSYNINIDDGTVDQFDLPNVIETNRFSQQDVLVKLEKLRNKITTYYLPEGCRIIDIIGLFTSYEKLNNVVYSLHQPILDTFSVDVPNIIYDKLGYISDLREQLFNVSSTIQLTNNPIISDGFGTTYLDFESDTKFDTNLVIGNVANGSINDQLNDNFQTFSEVFINYFINNDDLNLYTDNKYMPVGHILNLSVDNFSQLIYNTLNNSYDSVSSYTYDNARFSNVYEISWDINLIESTNTNATFAYSTRRGSLLNESIKVILPYIGIYSVRCTFHDLFEGDIVTYIDDIEIKSKNPDFIGIYKKNNEIITFNSNISYSQSDFQYDYYSSINTIYDDANVTYNSLDQSNYFLVPDYNTLDGHTYDIMRNAKFANLDYLTYDITNYGTDYDWVEFDAMNYPYVSVSHLTYNQIGLKRQYSDRNATFLIFVLNNINDAIAFPTSQNIGNNIILTNKLYSLTFEYGLVDSSNAVELENFINAANNFFDDYTFNITYLYDVNDNIIGLHDINVVANIPSSDYNCEIQYYTSIINGNLYNNGTLIGDDKGETIYVNIDYNELATFDSRVNIKPYNQITFTIDNCNIPSKRVVKWVVLNNTTNDVEEFEIEYLTYMFIGIAEYNVSVIVSDIYRNTNEIIKIGVINVRS